MNKQKVSQNQTEEKDKTGPMFWLALTLNQEIKSAAPLPEGCKLQ